MKLELGNSERIVMTPAKEKAFNAMVVALEYIAARGGNLGDAALTSRTGPNDAVARGLMYTDCRNVAHEALKLKDVQ